MKPIILLPVVCSFALTDMAAAQSVGVSPQKATHIRECESRWTAADRNGDGVLDMDEIEAAAALIPKTITSPASISQRQFMDACVKVAQAAND